jgi:hypothetical protein
MAYPRTYIHLSISESAFQEIMQKMVQAGYQYAIYNRNRDGQILSIDMNGIALISDGSQRRTNP